MKTWKEVLEFLDNIELGEPIYKITDDGWGDLAIKMDEWAHKEELSKSKNWLERCMAQNLRRRFCSSQNKMILNGREQIERAAKHHIVLAIMDAAAQTSPADKPKRTKAYKHLHSVVEDNMENEQFISDILPVVNYYYGAKTDSKERGNMKVHSDNTFALLEILRKKYGSKSSS